MPRRSQHDHGRYLGGMCLLCWAAATWGKAVAASDRIFGARLALHLETQDCLDWIGFAFILGAWE